MTRRFAPLIATHDAHPPGGKPVTSSLIQADLVLRAQRGDAEAFDSLARLVGARCLATARRIVRDGDVAEDAVQAALITAWTELGALRDPSRFQSWLHRILTHACYAEARRRRRWYEGGRTLPMEHMSDHDAYVAVDDRDLLERAFRRLTVQQRAVLVFRHYLGMPIADVAARAGLPVGTAKSCLHHAKRALRASIDADARGDPASRAVDEIEHKPRPRDAKLNS